MAIVSCEAVEFQAPPHPGLTTDGTNYSYKLLLSDEMEAPDAEIVSVYETPDGRQFIEWVGRKWPTFEAVPKLPHMNNEHRCFVRVEGALTVAHAMALSSKANNMSWFNIKYGGIIDE